MLGRRHRFHGYGSLKAVYQHGRTIRGGLIGLKYTIRDPQRPYRVAVVVSRKVHKSAVTRNRIRRRVYEIVRQNEPLIPPGASLVFTVYNDQLAELDGDKLATQISSLLVKVK